MRILGNMRKEIREIEVLSGSGGNELVGKVRKELDELLNLFSKEAKK